MTLRYGSTAVPFTASWSAEERFWVAECPHAKRPAIRQSVAQGEGKPLFGKPHSDRQRQVIADPLGEAISNAVRTLGERLHEIGGIKAMHQALTAVCDDRPDQAYWREGYLDRRWSGIGSWIA